MAATPIRYDIRVDKEGAAITATFDLSLPMGDTSMIATFTLSVDGTNLIGEVKPGNKMFKGSRTFRLADAAQDALVQFAMSTNQGWSDSDHGTLRGDKKYDDVHFAN